MHDPPPSTGVLWARRVNGSVSIGKKRGKTENERKKVTRTAAAVAAAAAAAVFVVVVMPLLPSRGLSHRPLDPAPAQTRNVHSASGTRMRILPISRVRFRQTLITLTSDPERVVERVSSRLRANIIFPGSDEKLASFLCLCVSSLHCVRTEIKRDMPLHTWMCDEDASVGRFRCPESLGTLGAVQYRVQYAVAATLGCNPRCDT